MGCICYPKKNNINILSNLNDMKINNSTNCELSKSIDYITVKNKRKDYFFHINKKGWENILDFFTYKELTIIAQLNRELRNISKNPRILNKFFKENKIEKLEEKSDDKLKQIQNKNKILLSKTNKSYFHTLNLKNTIDKFISNTFTKDKEKKENLTKKKKENKSQTLVIKMNNLNQKLTNINKNITPYIDYFTNQKIQIPGNQLLLNGYTASICSSSVGYHDHTPSFSDENISNRKNILNITNITTININQCSVNNKNNEFQSNKI